MFEEDEEELELLRQYEDKALDADEDEGHSSDGMDSDLEDKIMSMVQYGSGISKKKPIPAPPKPETRVDPAVVYAPTETDEKKKSEFSASNELQLQEDDESDEPDLYKSNNSESEDDHLSSLDTTAKTTTVAAEPTVTRYINLDDKQYIEDQETSEEEAELGLKLQELIEEQ
ncbi:uncharacterized protein B0P05DRAFT_568060, partial [Gilbertella persicaria]|uniref:uncharacterized protein n=1 Tax=Gilbertella persicaria TaxID=101096 RepID=UPI00221F7DCE